MESSVFLSTMFGEEVEMDCGRIVANLLLKGVNEWIDMLRGFMALWSLEVKSFVAVFSGYRNS